MPLNNVNIFKNFSYTFLAVTKIRSKIKINIQKMLYLHITQCLIVIIKLIKNLKKTQINKTSKKNN